MSDNKICLKKQKNSPSIFCEKKRGPSFAAIGFKDSGNCNMSQGEFMYYKDTTFIDFNNIIKNERKDRFFDVQEIEVYKLIFN